MKRQKTKFGMATTRQFHGILLPMRRQMCFSACALKLIAAWCHLVGNSFEIGNSSQVLGPAFFANINWHLEYFFSSTYRSKSMLLFRLRVLQCTFYATWHQVDEHFAKQKQVRKGQKPDRTVAEIDCGKSLKTVICHDAEASPDRYGAHFETFPNTVFMHASTDWNPK